jgi:hypothetical protein
LDRDFVIGGVYRVGDLRLGHASLKGRIVFPRSDTYAGIFGHYGDVIWPHISPNSQTLTSF